MRDWITPTASRGLRKMRQPGGQFSGEPTYKLPARGLLTHVLSMKPAFSPE